eukprot:scaffold285784_cov19-Tisochrysis_lutea.AAC.1
MKLSCAHGARDAVLRIWQQQPSNRPHNPQIQSPGQGRLDVNAQHSEEGKAALSSPASFGLTTLGTLAPALQLTLALRAGRLCFPSNIVVTFV